MRRLLAAALAMVFAVGGSALFAAPALADDPSCTKIILDNSKNHVLSGRTGSIQAQVNRFQAEGASVRVRVEESLTSDSDGYKNSMVSKCESWRTVKNGKTDLQANMVVIVIGLSTNGDYSQRDIGLYVGGQWYGKDGLGGDDLAKVRGETMAPKLKPYDHTKPNTWPAIATGITAGAKAMADKIHNVEHPDYTGWIIFWVIVAIVAIVVIVAVVLFVRRGGGGYGNGYGYSGYSSTIIIATNTTDYGGGYTGGDSGGGHSGF